MSNPMTLLRGARFLPPHSLPRGWALLIAGDRIVAVGEEDELRRSHRAELIDLDGAFLLPGFIDTHTHLFEWARRLNGIDLSGVDSLDGLESELRRQSRKVDDGREWIGGSGWDPALAAAGLDRSLLDEIFGNRPVALESRDFHILWCNTEALRRAGVLDGARCPPGGSIGRRRSGEPDGLLRETAWELIVRARPAESEEVRERWIRGAVRRAWGFGLIAVHSMEPSSTGAAYRALAERGRLGLRVVHHTPLVDLDARIAAEGNIAAGSLPPGSVAMERGGVKIFMDGSMGSGTAFMEHPYPGGGRGRLLMEKGELLETVLRAQRAGIPPVIHAIGDAAVTAVVEVLEKAAARLHEEGRGLTDGVRIEHAQFIAPKTVRRLCHLPVSCAMQPIHLAEDIPMLARLHHESGRRAFCTRSLLDAGVRVVLGSDAPVASIDPRQGICAAMARRAGNRPDGECWHGEEALTCAEAIAGYTGEAAALAASTREGGRLAEGARADLVALDGGLDPTDPFAWPKASVRLTMISGRIVHEDLG